MLKLLISLIGIVSLLTVGCTSVDRIPFVYQIDVQQGNVITQEQVDLLSPGISKHQASFIMGSSLISDTFHEDRWDYLYRMEPGKGPVEQTHVMLEFRDDKLIKVAGDLRPRPKSIIEEKPPRISSVTVPPQHKKPRGILTRLWHWLTRKDADAI